MGDVKQAVQPKSKASKDFFEGIRDKFRPRAKPQDGKEIAENYADQVVELERRNAELIMLKGKDVKSEPGRYDYNAKMLSELQIQNQLFQLILESLVRCDDLAKDKN